LHITKLALENFRIYPELQMEFSQGLTIIVGPNASGKTSLLEAIHLLATTKSPRTRIDRQLVRSGAPYSRLQGQFVSTQDQATNISIVLPGEHADQAEQITTAKQVKVNGAAIDRVSQMIGRVPVVMFSTEDLSIVKGSPGYRRRFLNVATAQLRPRYLDDLQRYRRALSQRNEVLKLIRHAGAPRSGVEPWDTQLIEAGAALAADRQEFTQMLSEAAELVHGDLTDGAERLVLRYQGDLADSDDDEARKGRFAELLAQNEDRDVECGYTTVGVHRDDFSMIVNGTALRRYGSQGQQRTAALSLKLAQADVVTAWREEPPLLLLDDCLSELDVCRGNRILELVQHLQGLIITSPVLNEILSARSDADFFRVENGSLEQITPGAAEMQ